MLIFHNFYAVWACRRLGMRACLGMQAFGHAALPLRRRRAGVEDFGALRALKMIVIGREGRADF